MKIGIQCVTDFSKGKSLKQFLRNSFLGFFTSYISLIFNQFAKLLLVILQIVELCKLLCKT